MDFSKMGIKGIEDASTIDNSNEKLKIAIVGDPGVGKSWLACTIPGTKFDIDFDGRKSSLSGKTDVVVKTYHDIDPSNPTAMSNFETDLKALEYAYAKGDEVPSTFIIDSATYCKKGTEAELIRQQSNMGRAIRIGATQLKIGAGWDIINGNRLYLEYIINKLAVMGNVICIFHEMYEKDESRSTPEKKVYTGKVTIQPQYLNTVTSIFNDYWRVSIDYTGKRVLQTGISAEFEGKCSLKGIDPLKEEPDISKLLEKHRKFVASNGI